VRWHANGFRLPTQAEWQYLYREGRTEADRLFPWQSDPGVSAGAKLTEGTGNEAGVRFQVSGRMLSGEDKPSSLTPETRNLASKGTGDRLTLTDADRSAALERGWLCANAGGATHPVAQKPANAFGLFDLDGNVAEWVWDWPGADYYRSRNPKGNDRPGLFGKAVMGSCFGSRAPIPVNRCTQELYGVPRAIFGFRVVRCDAGAHPEEDKLELKTVLPIDAKRFDPLQGRVARANLYRNGVFAATGLPEFHGVAWSFKTGGPVRSGPVVADGLVVFGSDNGSVYALAAQSGALKWTFKTEGPVRASVAVAGGTVYASSLDKHCYALDATNGGVRWKFKGRSPGTTAPAVAYGVVFAGFGYGWSGELAGLDVASGREVWRYRLDPINGLPNGIAIDGERLYVPVDDIVSVGVDLRTEYRLWRQSGTPTRSTMPVDEARVYYAAEGRMSALDKRTGERLWTWFPKGPPLRTTAEREPTASPAVFDGMVIQGWMNGQVAAVSADQGTLRWLVQSDAPVMSSPAVAGGLVYVANDDGVLLALQAADGKERWRHRLPAAVRSSPWLCDGVLYIGADDGALYALR
jgi:outer membrane protein assembly factor BamB